MGSEASAATVKPTSSAVTNGTLNATVVSTITSMGSTFTSTYAARVINGSTSVVTSGNATMGGMTSSASATGGGNTAGGAAAPTSTSSMGLAVMTKVPLAAAALGVMGLVGAAVVL